MDKKIRAEIFLRRFSRMQVIILGRIDKELDNDVFVKVMTANFLTVSGEKFHIILRKKISSIGPFLQVLCQF